jgi:hypothetical protein
VVAPRRELIRSYRPFARQRRICEAGDQSASCRREPEQPYGPAAGKYRRTCAACGVHLQIRHGNTDQVNQRQTQTDRDGRKTFGRLSSVAPEMIIRNMNVRTASAIRHASSAYPPRKVDPKAI